MRSEALIPDFDCVWVASNFCDTVSKRTKKSWGKQEREYAKYSWTSPRGVAFDSELAAWQHVIDRARERTSGAKGAIAEAIRRHANETKRLAKLERKLESVRKQKASAEGRE